MMSTLLKGEGALLSFVISERENPLANTCSAQYGTFMKLLKRLFKRREHQWDRAFLDSQPRPWRGRTRFDAHEQAM